MQASIITPTFNAASYIAGCIENVIAQGPVILEHIIADGGSTDGTVEIVEAAQKQHPHIKLLYGPDRGQSHAMNRGSAEAKAGVIGILNADDLYGPDTVEKAVAILERAKGPALVCGDCRIVNEAGETIYINRPRWLSPVGLLQDSWLFPIPANPSAYLYTRDVHDLVGGYDEDDPIAMDVEFLLTSAERARMIYVPEIWGTFRYIPGTKTFEDKIGPQRVTALIERHKRHLTPWQRLQMAVLRRRRFIDYGLRERYWKIRNEYRRLRSARALS